MKALFSLKPVDLLLQAKPGDLFIPVGPDFVECVCARTQETGAAGKWELPPDEAANVVVIACRVQPGEPEYYQPGHTAWLHASTPVTYVMPANEVSFVAR